MVKSRRPIFRESAMKQYLQRREQDILPQTVSPPFFTYSWIVLVLLVIAGSLAWSADVPTFNAASGVVTTQSNGDTAQALIFVPQDIASKVQVGAFVQFQIGSEKQTRTGQVTRIEPGVISPADARKRFSLDNGSATTIKGPSVVAVVSLGRDVSARTAAGSLVSAQIQTGSQSVLSQLTL